MKIAAVLTAYHPDERLAAVVDSSLRDCAAVIVVDNTPDGAPSLAVKLDDPRVTVLPVGRNLGLGGALNLGVGALPADAEAVLLMDQDSVLPDGLVSRLVSLLDSDSKIGIAAPTPWDDAHGEAYNFGTEGKTVEDRPAVITSGMLVRRAVVDACPFRADLFNDFVDVAFCVDARRSGFRVVQDFTLRLPHSMGNRQEHGVGPLTVRVTHYPPWRHYWIARNGVQFAKDYERRRPQGVVAMAIFLARKFLSVACWGPKRGAQLTALSRGVLDGLSGRYTLSYLPEGAYPPGVRDGE
jgi:rhamnosyltransferase